VNEEQADPAGFEYRGQRHRLLESITPQTEKDSRTAALPPDTDVSARWR
jgi:hypothetical protein